MTREQRPRPPPAAVASGAGLVDPAARTLEVLRLTGEHWTLLATHAGDVEVRAEPFAEVAIALAGLWDRGPGPDVSDPGRGRQA